VLSTFVRLRSPLSPGTDERPRPPDRKGRLAAAREMAVTGPLRDRAPHMSHSFRLGADLRRVSPDRRVVRQRDAGEGAPVPGRSSERGLWEASLPGAGLRAADLSGVDFSGAVLGDASLDLADLRGADFSAADVTGTSFRGAVADDTTTWPEGFDPTRLTDKSDQHGETAR